GLHTGEGKLGGDNYSGLDVNRAARIASSANGGQVLLSQTTCALVDGVLEDITTADLGEHRLKNLERPERLYQLSVAGLRTDFPPPRTLDTRPNNLLVQLSPFIGREKELVEVCGTLADNRLVTLTGPGGTGKTRLSIEVATEAMLNFADGAYFVPLGAVVDPGLVPSTIAQTLEVMEQGERAISDTLRDHLRPLERLLILDNFEQILDAASVVADLLAAAPRLKIVVTSRAPLHISGEQEYPVPSMAVPDPENLPPEQWLARYDAVALFVQRAGAVKPGFVLDEKNAPAIAAICNRLDGLPLAIELAAARVKILSPNEILERLESSLTFLTGGARDLPQRQQTLRDAIAWSYDLLDEPEKALFRRLAVFVGGFDFEGAGTVCNPGDELRIDTFVGLESLADKSLIRHYESDLGESRFRMLVVIREYALEALASEDDHDLIRRRHAGFFSAMVERAEPDMGSPEGWPDRLELENDNLRAVLQYCLETGDTETGLLLGGRGWRFWHLRNHLSEGQAWMEQLFALPAAKERTRARAKGLMALGSLTYWQGGFEETRRHYEEGLVIYREIKDKLGIAEALFNLGYLAAVERDYPAAIANHNEARGLYRELGDRGGEAWATAGAALAYSMSRDVENGMKLGEEAAKMFVELDDWYGEGNARYAVLQALRFSGRYAEALEETINYMVAALENGDLSGMAGGFDGQADIEWQMGHREHAIVLAGAADKIKETIGGWAPPTLLDIIDVRAAAHAELGEEATEAAWERGRGMSPEEAAAFAQKAPDA
ncbi:MAG: tetratricopeptide repeat protein, partial [Actinomycetota bacterium]